MQIIFNDTNVAQAVEALWEMDPNTKNVFRDKVAMATYIKRETENCNDASLRSTGHRIQSWDAYGFLVTLDKHDAASGYVMATVTLTPGLVNSFVKRAMGIIGDYKTVSMETLDLLQKTAKLLTNERNAA